MRYSSQVQTCGYDSCPCRGIHFISGNGVNVDYCDNGKRVRTHNGILPRSIYLHQLEKYAEYCQWHREQKEKYGDDLPALTAFEYREVNAARANEIRSTSQSDFNPQAVRGEHFV